MWIGILATLGKLAMAGKVGPGVAVALYLANGIQFHFFPEFTVDLYKVTVPLSPLVAARRRRRRRPSPP